MTNAPYPPISAPAIAELASAVNEDRRKAGADCAIIIPSHGEMGHLRAHLGRLGSQTEQDFDVILVSSASVPAPGKKTPPDGFGTVSIRLKKPLGAGAFYVGQKYAFENGYKTIILADVDAMPIGDRLVRRLKDAVLADNRAVHMPKASSVRGGRHSGSIHWYGAMHADVFAKSGFTYLPLYFGGVDDELEARILGSGIRMRHLADVSVSHPLYKPMQLPDAAARALNDIRNRAPQIYCRWPSVWPVMPLFSAFSMLAFCDNTVRWKERLGLGHCVLSSMVRGRQPPHFLSSGVRLVPYPESSLEEALSHDGPARAFALCMEVGESSFQAFGESCAKRGISCEKVFFEDNGNPARYSLSLLCGPFISGTAVVFSDWRLFFNPFLLLYRRVYLHDGASTWLVADSASVWKRLGRFLLTSVSFLAFIAAYIPASLVSWLGVGKTRLRYGFE